ncbi:hypothetical protein AOZ06_16290 [Kibdelosporangium phytohabitans]|uniref:Uncharacterized protein n=1 Tax=Kibdelosporangium phytohabitans TaxID=860235 RepID=A0A0N7F3C7_9PSEU|nr:hypothetical protein AOZ06_16290 [Kibdelosporangium phytohabitans]
MFQRNEKAQLTTFWWRWIAVAERTRKVSPPHLVFDLLVALLDPMLDPVQPDHFSQTGGLVLVAGRVVRSTGPPQDGGQTPEGFVRQRFRIGSGDDEAGVPVESPCPVRHR